jgi:hypothetical protein
VNQEQLQDYLTAQYVWAIQNDGAWYAKTSRDIRCGRWCQFQRVTNVHITRVYHELGREETALPLTTLHRSFILMLLWKQAGGGPPDRTWQRYDCQDFEFRLESATMLMAVKDHVDNANQIFERVETNFQDALSTIIEGNIMNQLSTQAFATKHYVYGQDVEALTEAQLIDAIKKIEAEIAQLGEVKTASKKIAAKKTELTEMLAKVVETLDAK